MFSKILLWEACWLSPARRPPARDDHTEKRAQNLHEKLALSHQKTRQRLQMNNTTVQKITTGGNTLNANGFCSFALNHAFCVDANFLSITLSPFFEKARHRDYC
jgi:hypothetical protein